MSGASSRRLIVRVEGIDSAVGTLEDDPDVGGYGIRFAYANGYSGPALSASMPPRVAPYGNAEARAYFDNLLPEGAQRLVVIPKEQEGARPFDENDVIGLLSALGGECPGAVMVTSEGEPPPKVPGVIPDDYAPLTDGEVERMLRDAARGRIPAQGDRVSLPGVQRKVALSTIDGGETFLKTVARGVPGTHFLKVDPVNDPRFEGGVISELLCMRVAAAASLPVADVDAISFDTLNALLVRRYDRVVSADGTVRRMHQEDAAQALGLDRKLKYEKDARNALKDAGISALMGPFAALTAAPGDTRDIIRRAVFLNWLLGNNDAHMKNFSLLHPADGGPPALAPLYDIVSVESLPGGWKEMAMPINGVAMAPAVGAADIEWLAAQDGPTQRKIPASVLRRRLNGFREIAGAVPAAIEQVIADDEVSLKEAEPLQNLVRARMGILSHAFGWQLPVP
jgi:serine/threonine-protein kinase HipA